MQAKLSGLKDLMPKLAYDFLLKVLQEDPKKRLTISDALRHPWINEAKPKNMQRQINLVKQV